MRKATSGGVILAVVIVAGALWCARSASRPSPSRPEAARALPTWSASPPPDAPMAPSPPGAPGATAIPPPLDPADRAPAPVAAKKASARDVDGLSEEVLMARIRSLTGSDPNLAIELARAADRRFPDSPHAAERSSILVHALAGVGRVREARAQAEYAVNHYPDSPEVRAIEQFSGAHRHRNMRINDAGAVEFQ